VKRKAGLRPNVLLKGNSPWLKADCDSAGGDRNLTSKPAEPRGVDRRQFLGGVGSLAAGVAAGGALLTGTVAAPVAEAAPPLGPSRPSLRRAAARKVRLDAAQLAFSQPAPPQQNSDEDRSYGGTRIGNFHKGLPHNSFGEVDPSAYHQLLRALETGDKLHFESIPLGGVRPLRNPQAGMAFDLEGPDAQNVTIRPAPRTDSAEGAGEAVELYWMALCRDVPFTDYASNPLAAAASADLSAQPDFRGPKSAASVTPATLFRGNTPGDFNGQYLSQFLLMDVPYGSLTISQRQQTVIPGVEYMTNAADWLNVQNGGASGPDLFDGTARYIRNGRDLGQYVHVDALYEAYLNACLILLGMGAPFDAGNPYHTTQRQDGFATFGGPHILSLVTEVATRALKAVWWQKWFVHRRLRPEAYGGLVHHRMTGARNYPLHSAVLNSGALMQTFSRFGSFLLPQAFPEGSPLHPAYGAGHASVAGACVTILKAWFDGSFLIPNPVVPSNDGLTLLPYIGPPLTVEGELNKVAANISFGRNFAGIHWRTDYSESLKLGEAIAIGLLREQAQTYHEDHSFTLTRFDGTTISISSKPVEEDGRDSRY